MEKVKKYNEIPDWAYSFLSTCMPEMEKEAAINVRTLPKVVWNDNTFYVALDSEEGNADVLNEYGNVVTALKNVKSVEDVEKQLNRQIVANNEASSKNAIKQAKVTKLDDELWKVAEVMNIETNNGMQTTDPSINKSVDTVTNTPSDVSSNIADQQAETANNAVSNINLQTQANSNQLKQRLDKRLADAEKTLTANLNTLNNHTCQIQENNTYTKQLRKEFQKELTKQKNTILNLQHTIKQLTATVKDLTDQIHAYRDPGNVFDLNCADNEKQHYTNTATQSAKVINIEHGTDLTTPKGRISLKDRILQDIGDIKMPEEILTESVPVEDLEITVNTPEKTEVEIVQAEDTSNENKTEADTIVDSENIDNNIEVIDVNNKDNVNFLPARHASYVQKRICPACHKKTLFLDQKTAEVQNIICKSCKAKFGVNLNDARIFRYSKR